MTDWFHENDRYLILTHVRPDGDTLGSAAALCEGLRSLGKVAYVAVNQGVGANLAPYVTGYYPQGEYRPDHIVSVDTATRDRLPDCYKDLEIDLCIDHHPSRKPYAKRNHIRTENAACGEIVYLLLRELGVELTQAIALPLYVAISTDTGCFLYANTTALTHAIAAELMQTGIDYRTVNEIMFEKKSRRRQELELYIYSNSEYLHGGQAALSILTRELIAKVRAKDEDMESLSSLTRKIEGVEIGLLLKEGSDGCKLSVRTSGLYRADHIAEVFGGGGHARAAGATLDMPLEQAVCQLKQAVQRVVENC